uniref:F4'OMT n=1 Tax=Plagiochasma appendiculatum TaxID=157224 RepID=A0A1X9Y2Y6_9MARC|nr:F4'OMT [Plagiochasma appendiculatum]WPJ67789.1 flavonoid 4'-O-methyltransferase [synthetic construct]
MAVSTNGKTSEGVSDVSRTKNITNGNGMDMSVSANVASIGSVSATPLSPEDKRDHVVAINFLLGWVQTWALKAVVTMRIPDIISKAPMDALTAREIISQIQCKNPSNAVPLLERLMRFMVCKGFFSESVNGENEIAYELNGVSKMYVTDHEMSVVEWVNVAFHRSGIPALTRMHEAITEDVCPWDQAHGMPIYAHNPKFPELGDFFHKAMIVHSNFLTKILAEEYEGFKDFKVLVDVGGSLGNNLALILRFHPHLRGINFDMPSVIAGAPSFPGVEHVGGNFYESVPSGDAIMLMAILHNNSDENCVKILRSVHAALPEDGKLIVAEYIMTNEADHNGERIRLLDMLMLVQFRGGEERTFEHHKTLYEAAGFRHYKLIKTSGPMDIIEVRK